MYCLEERRQRGDINQYEVKIKNTGYDLKLAGRKFKTNIMKYYFSERVVVS